MKNKPHKLSRTYLKSLMDRLPRIGSKPASPQFTTKMWILPSGRVHILPSWHSQFLLQREDEMKRTFGLVLTDLTRDDDQGIRVAALVKGFTRINYEHRDGSITFESNVRFWRDKLKDIIFAVVAVNAPKVDRIKINLLNDDATINKSGQSYVFMFEDAEKLKSIPLISKTTRGRALLNCLANQGGAR